MKTYVDVIDETVQYYNEDPTRRAYSELENGCVYFDEQNGNRCAVGRCLKNPQELAGVCFTADDLFRDTDHFDDMKEEYSHLYDIKFWSELQNLHDRTKYWTGKGITKMGLRKAKKLKEKWAGC